MNTSESIKEIATALSAAQGSLQDATKNAKNPHFKSDYADLSHVLEAIRPALKAQNLSVVQLPFSSGTRVGVTTAVNGLRSRLILKSKVETSRKLLGVISPIYAVTAWQAFLPFIRKMMTVRAHRNERRVLASQKLKHHRS